MFDTGRPFWAYNSNDKTRFFSPSGGVPKSVDGAPISLITRGCGVEAETIIEAFRVLLDEGAPQWDPAKVERLAEGTGWTRAAASFVTIYGISHLLGMTSVVSPEVIASMDFQIGGAERSEERRVGKECRSRWSPYH